MVSLLIKPSSSGYFWINWFVTEANSFFLALNSSADSDEFFISSLNVVNWPLRSSKLSTSLPNVSNELLKSSLNSASFSSLWMKLSIKVIAPVIARDIPIDIAAWSANDATFAAINLASVNANLVFNLTNSTPNPLTLVPSALAAAWSFFKASISFIMPPLVTSAASAIDLSFILNLPITPKELVNIAIVSLALVLNVTNAPTLALNTAGIPPTKPVNLLIISIPDVSVFTNTFKPSLFIIVV